LPLHFQRLLYQLPESKFFQQRANGEQSAISSQILIRQKKSWVDFGSGNLPSEW
jgi:hypothetical protein